MFRSFFLYLSGAGTARKLLIALPFATRVTRRFVAGETLDDAIRVVRTLNAKGILASLDHLGENVHTEADANRAAGEYVELLDRIAQTGIKSNVSLKLTQLGLDIGEEICVNHMRRLLQHAQELGNFIRIDMESAAYTDRTLRVFRTLREEHGFTNVGVVLQAYLYRSEQDVRQLASEGANIRLCKGAYKEPPDVAFPDKADVDKSYVKLSQIYLDDAARAKGAHVAFATHDDKMIAAAKECAASHHIPNDQIEFQMLYGIRPQRQEELAAEGYRMRVYVPYGREWYPYFMRRLAERPANVWFLARSFFRA